MPAAIRRFSSALAQKKVARVLPDSMPSADGKPKGPSDNAYLQQKMPVQHLVFTTKCVLLTLAVAGIVCTVIGAVALAYADRVVQFQFTYSSKDKCVSPCPAQVKQYGQDVETGRCQDPEYSKGENAPQSCTVRFVLPKDIPGPVYFYYTLDNYHQNHRRYVASIDLYQIKGEFGKEDAGSEPAGHSKCTIATENNNGSFADFYEVNGKKIWYYPCGLIARTLFNDTFALKGPNGDPVAWRSDTLAWKSSGADNKFISKNETWLRRNCYSLGGSDFELSRFPKSLADFSGTKDETKSRCILTHFSHALFFSGLLFLSGRAGLRRKCVNTNNQTDGFFLFRMPCAGMTVGITWRIRKCRCGCEQPRSRLFGSCTGR